uniref:Arrestin_C domain-containing protein n=1 Tax=Anisakis simplex TaxID=6269 RepID=A0A0M3J2J1_ANISI
LSIVQLASCFATYPSPATRDCAFETSGVGLPIPKIPSGNTYKYAPEFYVPALVPDFEILGRLKVDHFLKLEIGFNRHQKSKHAICLIKIPILIGTSTAPERPPPPSDNDAWWTKVASDSAAGKSTDGGAEGESLESGYMPNAFSRLPPPPTYLESITGRSNVQDEDDAECPAYTPLYYGHNPAFTNGIEVPSYDDKKEN